MLVSFSVRLGTTWSKKIEPGSKAGKSRNRVIKTKVCYVFCCDKMSFVREYYVVLARESSGRLWMSPPTQGPPGGAQFLWAKQCILTLLPTFLLAILRACPPPPARVALIKPLPVAGAAGVREGPMTFESVAASSHQTEAWCSTEYPLAQCMLSAPTCANCRHA